ncbi:MAG: hypothetical protein ACWA49_00185 [Ruegeria sp.]
MTMSDKDTELDLLFDEARRTRRGMPDHLAVRILEDAEYVRLKRLTPASRVRPAFLQSIVDGLGGWKGIGGLVTASVVGVWVGFSAPAFLPDPASYFVAQDPSYMVASLGLEGAFLEEAE